MLNKLKVNVLSELYEQIGRKTDEVVVTFMDINFCLNEIFYVPSMRIFNTSKFQLYELASAEGSIELPGIIKINLDLHTLPKSVYIGGFYRSFYILNNHTLVDVGELQSFLSTKVSMELFNKIDTDKLNRLALFELLEEHPGNSVIDSNISIYTLMKHFNLINDEENKFLCRIGLLNKIDYDAEKELLLIMSKSNKSKIMSKNKIKIIAVYGDDSEAIGYVDSEKLNRIREIVDDNDENGMNTTSFFN